MERSRLRWLLPVGAFMGPFGGDAIFPLIPTFQAELGISVAQANSLITAYMVPFALLLLVSGAVAETFGERRVMEAGFGLYGAGALLVAVSPDFGFMLAARAVQGSGSALITPVLLGAIGHQFGPELRGRVMGLFSVFIALGNVAGPVTGGWMEAHYDWRTFFALLAGVAAFFGAMYLFLVRNRGSGRGVSETVSRLRGVASNRSVLAMSLSGAAVFFALIGAASFTSDYLSGPPLSLGEAEIGLVISAGFGVGVLAGAVSGYLADLLGRRETGYLGFGVMGLGSAVLLSVAVGQELYRFVGGLVLVGFGAHTAFTAFNTLAVELVPEARGTAASVYNSFRFLGYGLAPVVLAPLYGFGVVGVYVGVAFAVVAGSALLYVVEEPAGDVPG